MQIPIGNHMQNAIGEKKFDIIEVRLGRIPLFGEAFPKKREIFKLPRSMVYHPLRAFGDVIPRKVNNTRIRKDDMSAQLKLSPRKCMVEA